MGGRVFRCGSYTTDFNARKYQEKGLSSTTYKDQVPNGADVLLRILPLVKKKGLLILEDAFSPVHHVPELVPGFVTFWKRFQEAAKNRGIDLDLPRSYVQTLKDSGMFDEITCRVEFCDYSEGDGELLILFLL